jgi:transposase
MILGFKTELHPTNQQKRLLAKHAGVARHAYNCEYCGFSCDRDLDASLNLAMAVSSTVTACGLDNADVARRKQE